MCMQVNRCNCTPISLYKASTAMQDIMTDTGCSTSMV